jgi:flagellar M-ring protein FliF
MLLIALGGVLVLVVVLGVVFALNGGGAAKKEDPSAKPLLKTQKTLATDISAGRALEIQALLARQGIRLDTEAGTGGKVSLMLGDEASVGDKDRAILGMVQGGLMDGHLGLEAFDSSDMMASPDEKRVKLMRAQQGELARLVRKMPPVEDATVKLAMPDPTSFGAAEQKPSASIQVVLPPNERLHRDQVRAIINLAVGAVQGLEPKQVALTDTNGNTYNSILNSSMELQDKVEEQDQYMKQKIAGQLDRLVGAGHYVVTVSTLLREAPRETMVQSFDPDKSAISTKQRFTEKLGNGGGGGGAHVEGGGPVSSFLPPELDSKVALEGPGKGFSTFTQNEGGDGYKREGSEVSYSNGRTQWVESRMPGMVEAISIAVTIDDKHFPNMAPEELQELIARAANPKVPMENVSLARTDFQNPTAVENTEPLSEPDTNPAQFALPGMSEEATSTLSTWLPWVVISLIGLVVLILLLGAKNQSQQQGEGLQRAMEDLNTLRSTAQQQQEALMQQQQLNQQLMQTQQQQQQALLQTQQQQAEKMQATLQKLSQSLGSAAAGGATPNAPTTAVDPNRLDISNWLGS